MHQKTFSEKPTAVERNRQSFLNTCTLRLDAKGAVSMAAVAAVITAGSPEGALRWSHNEGLGDFTAEQKTRTMLKTQYILLRPSQQEHLPHIEQQSLLTLQS